MAKVTRNNGSTEQVQCKYNHIDSDYTTYASNYLYVYYRDNMFRIIFLHFLTKKIDLFNLENSAFIFRKNGDIWFLKNLTSKVKLSYYIRKQKAHLRLAVESCSKSPYTWMGNEDDRRCHGHTTSSCFQRTELYHHENCLIWEVCPRVRFGNSRNALIILYSLVTQLCTIVRGLKNMNKSMIIWLHVFQDTLAPCFH